MGFDLIIFGYTCTALLRNSSRSGLWHLLFRDGLIYWTVTFSVNMIPAVSRTKSYLSGSVSDTSIIIRKRFSIAWILIVSSKLYLLGLIDLLINLSSFNECVSEAFMICGSNFNCSTASPNRIATVLAATVA